MADADDKDKKKDEKAANDEQAKPAGTKISILTWIIVAVIVVLLAGSGFVLGRLFAGSGQPETAKAEASQEPEQTEETENTDAETSSGDTWYYNDLESIVVNPDEPGATRFVRIGLTLEISSALSEAKAKELINAKKPPLVNWVNLYFKGLTLDQMRNDRDMKRIQAQILDSFNEILFADGKPHIKKVLIREFNIQ